MTQLQNKIFLGSKHLSKFAICKLVFGRFTYYRVLGYNITFIYRHSSLEDRIYKKFFVKHSSTDNGSSLFHSVSICLVSTEDLSTTLRLLTTLYAVEHFKDYHEKVLIKMFTQNVINDSFQLLSSFSTIAYEYFGLRDITSSGVPDGDNLSISLKYEALKTATDANASGSLAHS